MANTITYNSGKLAVPASPALIVLQGDGIGREITQATLQTLDAAVEKAYGGKKKITWKFMPAGEEARALSGRTEAEIRSLPLAEQQQVYLPEETIAAIRKYKIGIKGPLGTPIGGGIRSLNVTLRKLFDLYACIRPIHYVSGAPSPLKHPQQIDMVVFRENTEDIYAGIEFPPGSEEEKKLEQFLRTELGVELPERNYGLGIKVASEEATKRLARRAIAYAIEQNRKFLTIIHKGNIAKYTEGQFRKWVYEVAEEEFAEKVITEAQLWENYNGTIPAGRLILKDRIADAMLQETKVRSNQHEVLICPNMNGDYFSDDLAALIGGLGIAPGANIGDEYAIFEATHGTAPDIAGKNIANPSSLMLSGAMLLDHIGWHEAAELVRWGIAKTIRQAGEAVRDGHLELPVTFDFLLQYQQFDNYQGTKTASTQEYAGNVIKNMSEKS